MSTAVSSSVAFNFASSGITMCFPVGGSAACFQLNGMGDLVSEYLFFGYVPLDLGPDSLSCRSLTTLFCGDVVVKVFVHRIPVGAAIVPVVFVVELGLGAEDVSEDDEVKVEAGRVHEAHWARGNEGLFILMSSEKGATFSSGSVAELRASDEDKLSLNEGERLLFSEC